MMRRTPDPATVVVLGVGNADRGDDGAGPAVAAAVAGRGLRDVDVRWPAEPLDLLDTADATALVVIVDAVRSGAQPGTFQVLDVDGQTLPQWSGAESTHAVGISAAVELAQVMGRMPRHLVLVGVEAESFTLGMPMSAAVRDAVEPVAAAVTGIVGAAVRGES